MTGIGRNAFKRICHLHLISILYTLIFTMSEHLEEVQEPLAEEDQ